MQNNNPAPTLAFDYSDHKKFGITGARLLYFLHTLPDSTYATIHDACLGINYLAVGGHHHLIEAIEHLKPFEVLEVHTQSDCKYPCAMCTSIRLKAEIKNKEIILAE